MNSVGNRERESCARESLRERTVERESVSLVRALSTESPGAIHGAFRAFLPTTLADILLHAQVGCSHARY